MNYHQLPHDGFEFERSARDANLATSGPALSLVEFGFIASIVEAATLGTLFALNVSLGEAIDVVLTQLR